MPAFKATIKAALNAAHVWAHDHPKTVTALCGALALALTDGDWKTALCAAVTAALPGFAPKVGPWQPTIDGA